MILKAYFLENEEAAGEGGDFNHMVDAAFDEAKSGEAKCIRALVDGIGNGVGMVLYCAEDVLAYWDLPTDALPEENCMLQFDGIWYATPDDLMDFVFEAAVRSGKSVSAAKLCQFATYCATRMRHSLLYVFDEMLKRENTDGGGDVS